MKKRLFSLSLLCVLLFSLLPATALAMSNDDYDLYYEIAEYLCSDWETPYDDLIWALAEYYNVSENDIYDFIDYAMWEDSDHVWIPVNGGTKYHRTDTCSKMVEPRPSTKKMARKMGFGACGRCKP